MAEVEIDVAKLNEAVREEARLVQTAVDEVRKVIVGQRRSSSGCWWPALPRPPAARGRAGPRQDAGGEDAGPGAGPAVRADPVHARPAARRPRRHADLQPEVRRVRGPQGARLRQPAAGRRDQPRARQGAVGAARGDAGAPGHARRRDAPAARPVPRPRDAEPDRAGGHLPAARGAGRPLPAEGEGRLPDEGRGAPDPRPHDLGRGAGRRQGALGRRRAPPRGPRARGLHGRAPGDYIVALVSATRTPREVGLVDLAPLIAYGASPRATLAFSEAPAPSPSCAAAATSSPRT